MLPTMPDPRELDWLAQVMAERMLLDAASAPRQDQRLSALRAWFPECQYTETQMLVIGEHIAGAWRGLAGAVHARTAAREAAGRAKPMESCRDRP